MSEVEGKEKDCLTVVWCLFTNQITAAIKLVANIIILMAYKYPKCRIERERERERELVCLSLNTSRNPVIL